MELLGGFFFGGGGGGGGGGSPKSTSFLTWRSIAYPLLDESRHPSVRFASLFLPIAANGTAGTCIIGKSRFPWFLTPYA